MVGRGRGRGSQLSGVEQLGFGVGESMPTPVLQPPPLYPPLENRPVPLRCTPEDEYCVELRRDFIECLHDSPAYLVAQTVRSDIERYSDRYQTAVTTKSKQQPLTFPTNHLPAELRPLVKAKREKLKKTAALSAAKAVDVTSRLEELEKTEGQVGDAEEEEEQKDSEEKEADEAEDKDEEEVEDPDEEMDDGTDYANNYFDNGEGYLDEDDDNLEDGPVY